jgi:hypothetical protein
VPVQVLAQLHKIWDVRHRFGFWPLAGRFWDRYSMDVMTLHDNNITSLDKKPRQETPKGMQCALTWGSETD